VKKFFDDYLNSIGLAESLKNRVAIVLEDYKQICDQTINDIFVSEFIKEDGTREYESIWLFSNAYTMEAKKFINEDNFDVTAIAKCIDYYQIRKKEYRFGKPSDQSRLIIDFITEHEIKGSLKASKTNCTNLWNIFLKYIKPNIVAKSSWL
jgi:hypothetical protein